MLEFVLLKCDWNFTGKWQWEKPNLDLSQKKSLLSSCEKPFLGFVVRLFSGKVKVFLVDEENEEANRNDFTSQWIM